MVGDHWPVPTTAQVLHQASRKPFQIKFASETVQWVLRASPLLRSVAILHLQLKFDSLKVFQICSKQFICQVIESTHQAIRGEGTIVKVCRSLCHPHLVVRECGPAGASRHQLGQGQLASAALALVVHHLPALRVVGGCDVPP